jgi:hypothetical protein
LTVRALHEGNDAQVFWIAADRNLNILAEGAAWNYGSDRGQALDDSYVAQAASAILSA